jgi:hypothetical protein
MQVPPICLHTRVCACVVQTRYLAPFVARVYSTGIDYTQPGGLSPADYGPTGDAAGYQPQNEEVLQVRQG